MLLVPRQLMRSGMTGRRALLRRPVHAVPGVRSLPSLAPPPPPRPVANKVPVAPAGDPDTPRPRLHFGSCATPGSSPPRSTTT